MKKLLLMQLVVSTLLLSGCAGIAKLVIHAPTAQTTLQSAARIPPEQVFDCAQQRMHELQKPNSFFWRAEVTRRDLAAGVLETGNFQEDNIIGFRLRLEYQPATGAIHLRIKGAGIYFTDLGVDQALATFQQGFEPCLWVQP